MVRSDAGLDALLAPPDVLELDGTRRWTLPTNLGPELHALRSGQKVFLTSYDRSAPGATLACLDARTGTTEWTADVELLATGRRPRYTTFNVDLWLDGDAVVLHGTESEQEYLEVFAIADGKRLLSVVRAR